MNILLVTPPFTQLNTPYPATSVLTAFLKKEGHNVIQYDLSIDLANRIFTKNFLEQVFEIAFNKERLSFKAKAVASRKWDYIKSIDTVWSFLKGEDSSIATRITTRGFLPESGRFKKVKDDNLDWAFGSTGFTDRAKHIATLYIEDVADFIADIITPSFEMVRYGEQIAVSAPTFDYIEKELQKPTNIIDTLMLDMLNSKINETSAELVCFTVPFPGTLYAALKCGEYIKTNNKAKVALGGGYVNTELRSLSDPRIFNYADYILYDDGELPLRRLTAHISGEKVDLIRTKYLENGKVSDSGGYDQNLQFEDMPAPDFSGLDFSQYISFIELTNPMHKLWSDGKWNKMTVAHGCYWAKCAFCDTSLDYICRYEAPSADIVVDRMVSIMKQTGQSGFHFTDEALPPKLLKEIATEIIDRQLTVSFWGNIRFEKAFTPELCELLAEAGCIAVSGGLEVASDRVLKLINKGVTIEGAKKCCSALTDAGIMVHAYLMYGFPTQTAMECVRSLDVVREWFEDGLLQSAFWHRYTMTIHSPSGENPEKYGARRVDNTVNPFANNGVDFEDDENVDWDTIGDGLSKATYNYMLGAGYDIPIKNWIQL